MTTTESVRSASKALLGSRYRLELAAAIASLEPGVFYTRQLASATGLPDNVVHQELRHFADAGIIHRYERTSGDRAQYYERLASVYWQLATELVAEASAAPSRSSPSQKRA